MKYFKVFKLKNYPVIINLPHSSINIPAKFREDFIVKQADLKKQNLLLTDLFTDQLYQELFKYFGGIKMGVSRLVTDIERFENDKNEPMAKVGMGALYTLSTEGHPIRKLSVKRKQTILKSVYRPYHRKLTQLVGQCLKKFNYCLIIDCHSFPNVPRCYEINQKKPRPDIDLGWDQFHTPKKLRNFLAKLFKQQGFSVKQNSPYDGTMIPLKYYKKDKRVNSVMLEVNRKLYMDEKKFCKKKSFTTLAKKIITPLTAIKKTFD